MINDSLDSFSILTSQIKNKILKESQIGKIDTLKNLQEKYPDIHWTEIKYDKTGDSLLHVSAQLGFTNVVQYLLECFQPILVDYKNKDDKTALHEAAQFSQYEVCKLLLNYGANVNALKRADWTPLMLACTKITSESLNIVKLLFEKDALINYVNKDGWSSLHLTAREGAKNIFIFLIKCGGNVTKRTKNGRTTLHIASLHGNYEIVEVLLTKDLNIDEKDNCGSTALHEAVLGNNINLVKLLIEHKAGIYKSNNNDYNILHLVASEGHNELIEFILKDLKYNVNISNRNGLTALHCAARKNKHTTYDILIKNGANEFVKDNFNRLPKDYFR